jgi:hypothetical protein
VAITAAVERASVNGEREQRVTIYQSRQTTSWPPTCR